MTCHNCSSLCKKFGKFGPKRIQRWRCKQCKKTFSEAQDKPPNELKPEAREAKHGEKMIEVKVLFWTDSIAPTKGKIIPKNAWTSGVVRIESNKAHGITPQNPVP